MGVCDIYSTPHLYYVLDFSLIRGLYFFCSVFLSFSILILLTSTAKVMVLTFQSYALFSGIDSVSPMISSHRMNACSDFAPCLRHLTIKILDSFRM